MTYVLRNFMMFCFVGLIVGGLWVLAWATSTISSLQPPVLRAEPAIVRRAFEAALQASAGDDISGVPTVNSPFDLI
jgi:hypothetical protein